MLRCLTQTDVRYFASTRSRSNRPSIPTLPVLPLLSLLLSSSLSLLNEHHRDPPTPSTHRPIAPSPHRVSSSRPPPSLALALPLALLLLLLPVYSIPLYPAPSPAFSAASLARSYLATASTSSTDSIKNSIFPRLLFVRPWTSPTFFNHSFFIVNIISVTSPKRLIRYMTRSADREATRTSKVVPNRSYLT